ncbi:MAG: hypothetical protein ACFCUE_00335 [Candidatus Bathyarchaeia archaeon]|jgi:hypothetical protein
MAKNPNIQQKTYSKSSLILGNLTIVLWIALGALCCALFIPLTAILFFAATAFLIFFEIGKHGCVSCFLCKTCTIGMGKLPELFFSKKPVVNVNRRALQLFPLAYLLLSVLPLVLVTVSLLEVVTVYRVVLLVGVLAFSVYTGVVKRKTLIHRIP